MHGSGGGTFHFGIGDVRIGHGVVDVRKVGAKLVGGKGRGIDEQGVAAVVGGAGVIFEDVDERVDFEGVIPGNLPGKKTFLVTGGETLEIHGQIFARLREGKQGVLKGFAGPAEMVNEGDFGGLRLGENE